MRDVNKSVHEDEYRVIQYHHEAHQSGFKLHQVSIYIMG